MKFSYGSEHTILIVNLKNNWTSFTYISVELTKEIVSYDAITYIKKLQDEGKSLTQMLQAMEKEVQVETMDGNKLWRKMNIEKKEMEVQEINGS
ncbi:hypothetical protein MTR_4g091950 [Medicago truncatula]|uniref:Uncharacterized protein n=1 Tax=Medicago truncatula TaxID=3880 RepID=A0A072UZ71_MEDTR|nr:hypothetical protein MTR_4g091950 [Medicago truncatula]